MSRFTVQGKVELDLEKAQKGVIELDSSIEQVGKTTKKVSDDSGRFMRGFSSSMKSASISGEQAGKKIGDAFSNALGPVGLIVTGIMSLVKIIKDAVGQSEEASEALGDLGKLLKTVFKPVLDLVVKGVTALANGFSKLIGLIPGVSAGIKSTKEGQEKYNEELDGTVKLLERIQELEERSQKLVEYGLKTEADALRDQVDMFKAQLVEAELTLAEKRRGFEELLKKGAEDFAPEEIRIVEGYQAGGYGSYMEIYKNLEKGAKLWQQAIADAENEVFETQRNILSLQSVARDKERQLAESTVKGEVDAQKLKEDAILKAHKNRLKVIDDLVRHIEDADEREIASNQLKLESYNQLQGELKALFEAEGYTSGDKTELYKIFENAVEVSKELEALLENEADDLEHILTLEMMREDIAKSREKFEASRASAINKYNLGLMSATELETTLNLLAIQHNEEVNALYGNYRDVEGAVDLVYESMLEVKKVIDDTNDALHETLANISDFLFQASASVLDITRRIAEDQIDIIYRQLEEQRELLDTAFNESKRRMEEERQRALELAGLVKAETEKGLEEALEAAIASGDERTIYEEKRRQKELAINKEYDAKELQAKEAYDAEVERAETEANKRIAQLQYKQSMFEWTASLTQAGVNIAEAITKAMAQTGIMAPASVPIIASLGALQVGAIMANIPQVPKFKHGGVMGLPETYFSKFADGGIARGSTQRGVDAIPALIAKGEMILNDGQQSNLFDMINRGGGGLHIEVPLVVDGIEMARLVINSVNAGRTQKIQARMVG